MKNGGLIALVPGHPTDRLLSHTEVMRHVTRGANIFLNANEESNKIVIPTYSGHTERLLNVKSAFSKCKAPYGCWSILLLISIILTKLF